MAQELSDRIAAAGAAWLDEVVPDWWRPELINLSWLDMAHGSCCVLGQLFGGSLESFDRALERLGLSKAEEAALGFTQLRVYRHPTIAPDGIAAAGVEGAEWFELLEHGTRDPAQSTEYPELTRAWTQEIRSRRARAASELSEEAE